MNSLTRTLTCAIALTLGGLPAKAQNFTPVTDAMLQNPDPADWLNWRRTLDGWGYSPLKQINTERPSAPTRVVVDAGARFGRAGAAGP